MSFLLPLGRFLAFLKRLAKKSETLTSCFKQSRAKRF